VASADTKTLVINAVQRFQQQVPALQQLKLVVGLELRGRGDTQLYRVEGTVADWREAFVHGHAKATGPPEILQLIERVVDRQQERSRTKKASH